MGKPSRADVSDADDWWNGLTDDRRVSTHRWLTGKGKVPPPQQEETPLDVDGEVSEGARHEPG